MPFEASRLGHGEAREICRRRDGSRLEKRGFVRLGQRFARHHSRCDGRCRQRAQCPATSGTGGREAKSQGCQYEPFGCVRRDERKLVHDAGLSQPIDPPTRCSSRAGFHGSSK